MEIIAELKSNKLPTFGNKAERLDRLKKHYGIVPTKTVQSKDSVVNKIEMIKKKREDRRAELEKKKQAKALKEAENQAMGKLGDVEFQLMIQKKRFKEMLLAPHRPSRNMKLCVCVRKRPIFEKEEEAGENDSVSCANPQIKIFESKLKVDGITKYVDEHVFSFDNTFNENESTEDVYKFALAPCLDMIFQQGMVTIFAYGQTSSGKTYTMKGIQESSVRQLFQLKDQILPESLLKVSFYEIYGGNCYDLLNEKAKVQILEDKNNNVVIQGLVEEEVHNENDLLNKIAFAFDQRTTHSTIANDTSSRSHAICKISVKDEYDDLIGVLIVCDLAGSERANDTKSNSRQRRIEGAQINTSLLALKECIRAMDTNEGHIPFRASKLTLSLRDSFKSKKFDTKVIMMACVCPGSSSSDHTLNTLRYADRLKSKKPQKLSNLNSNIGSKNYNRRATSDEKKIKESQNNYANQLNNSKNPYSNGSNIRSRAETNPSKQINGKNYISQRDYNRPLTKLNSSKNGTKLRKLESNGGNKTNKKLNKLHPVPNAPPPLPQNLQQLNEQKKKERQDLDILKNTLKNENNEEPDDYFNFQEKVEYLLDLQEDIMNMHLTAIREDAQMLKKESEIISNARSNDADYEIDTYIKDTEEIVKKKLSMYKEIAEKIKLAKKALAEEEEYSKKVKNLV